MAVLIEGFSVVVRNSTLATKYPGGVESYRRDCPNGSFCADEYLSRVGFMAAPLGVPRVIVASRQPALRVPTLN